MNINEIQASAKTYVLHHIFYIVLIVLGLLAGRAWLQEHDHRLVAEQQEKISEANVKASELRYKDLQAQLDQVRSLSDARVNSLEAAAKAVKTAPQAIAALPSVSNVPFEVIPDRPDRISVEAVPFYQEQAACRVTEEKLGSCQKEEVIKDQQLVEKTGQVVEKDKEIAALKKKPSFWKRLGSETKSGSVFISIGITIAKVFL